VFIEEIDGGLVGIRKETGGTRRRKRESPMTQEETHFHMRSDSKEIF
jgi:hypothetical protein